MDTSQHNWRRANFPWKVARQTCCWCYHLPKRFLFKLFRALAAIFEYFNTCYAAAGNEDSP